MSGHSKWANIKHRKETTDKKRGVVFTKLLNAISIAAREEPNPEFNPKLRSMIEKARSQQVPRENILHAIERNKDKTLQELTIEAYGPGGIAIIIKAITDNTNRTIAEIKHLLSENNARFAEPGSVTWAFDGEIPKFPQEASPEDRQRIQKLIKTLEEHSDVQKIITNLLKL